MADHIEHIARVIYLHTTTWQPGIKGSLGKNLWEFFTLKVFSPGISMHSFFFFVTYALSFVSPRLLDGNQLIDIYCFVIVFCET